MSLDSTVEVRIIGDASGAVAAARLSEGAVSGAVNIMRSKLIELGLASRENFDQLGDAAERTARRAEAASLETVGALGRMETAGHAAGGAFGLLAGSLTGFAASVGVDQILNLGKATLDFADDLAAAANQAGINVERYQSLKEALRYLEVDGAKADRSFKSLADTLGAVQSGTAAGGVEAALDRMGITANILNGTITTTDQLLDAVAASASRFKTEAEFTAAVVDLVGRKFGVDLAAALRDGGVALHEHEAQWRATGSVISEQYINRLADANEAIDGFVAHTKGTFVIFAAQMISQWDAMTAAVGRYIDAHGGLANTPIFGMIGAAVKASDASVVADNFAARFPDDYSSSTKPKQTFAPPKKPAAKAAGGGSKAGGAGGAGATAKSGGVDLQGLEVGLNNWLYRTTVKVKESTARWAADVKQGPLAKAFEPVAKSWQVAFGRVAGSWGNVLARMATLQQGFGTTINQLWSGILGNFTNMIAQMIGQWVMMHVLKVTVQKSANAIMILSDAKTAAAAAWKAVVGVPFIGPILAPVAAAAAFAGVMAFSAEDGYSVPAWAGAGIDGKGGQVGIVHPEEMILPKKEANMIRGGGAGGGNHLHIHCNDSRDVEQWAERNKHKLAKAMKSAFRDGYR